MTNIYNLNLFKNVWSNSVLETLTLKTFADSIRNGVWRNETISYQSLADSHEKRLYKRCNVPAIEFPRELFCFDFDTVTNQETARKQLADLRFIALIATSIGGSHLFAVARKNPSAPIADLIETVSRLTGLQHDASTLSYTRRVVCYDPKVFYNHIANEFS